MEILQARALEYIASDSVHESPGRAYKILFQGSDLDPANNYQLSLIQQAGFYSPQLSRNFDQLRYSWKGDFTLDPDTTLHEGELCYQPEGVPYGPETSDSSPRIVYLLQFGGASGQGYVSREMQKKYSLALEQKGTFFAGQFQPHDGGPAVDAYQAIWQQINAWQKLKPPAPRYRNPILLSPDNFAWKSLQREDMKTANAWHKLLGVFTERGTTVQMLKLEPLGNIYIVAQDANQFLIVRKGLAKFNGLNVEPESVVRLKPNTGANICSEIGVEVLHYIVPMIR